MAGIGLKGVNKKRCSHKN